MALPILDVVAGADFVRDLTLVGSNRRDAITTYTGSAVLGATLGYGDDRMAAYTATATWVTPSQGVIRIAISRAITSAAGSGLFRLYLSITTNDVVHYDQIAFLRILPAPGGGTAGKTYCSADDMLRHARWIEDLVTVDPRMQSDFAEQRARARSWLDDCIIRHDRPSEWHRWGATPSDVGFSPYWGFGTYGDAFPNAWLREQLDADKLIVSDATREICARKAIAFLAEDQIGPTPGSAGEGSTTYQDMARRYHRMADSQLAGYVAEIDTNGDGATDYIVRLGVFIAR